MKSQIMQILEMQAEGRLTKDQAAELLAALADQAREKAGAASSTHAAPTGEAPGPQGAANDAGPTRMPPPKKPGNGATAVLQDFVDTAVNVGTTVGRVASQWGQEFLHMVHRDEGGNSVTLSKVESPAGEGFRFRGNVINVSKVAGLTLNQAEVTNNNINASKVDHVAVRRGRFSQCEINGSSVGHLTIEGPEAIVMEGHVTDVPATGIRGVVFNASKCSRVKVLSSGHLDACTVMSSVMKDWEVAEGSGVKGLKLSDANVTGVRLMKGHVSGMQIERSAVHGLSVREATLEGVKLTSVRCDALSVHGGTWNDVTFRRDAIGTGSGGRDSSAEETLFENCTLNNVEFAGCTFKRTVFRNVNISGISVRNVDFTGMTLDGDEAFRRAAGV